MPLISLSFVKITFSLFSKEQACLFSSHFHPEACLQTILPVHRGSSSPPTLISHRLCLCLINLSCFFFFFSFSFLVFLPSCLVSMSVFTAQWSIIPRHVMFYFKLAGKPEAHLFTICILSLGKRNYTLQMHKCINAMDLLLDTDL